eukprot:8931419-Alexandrium_andersonii.AAC.1
MGSRCASASWQVSLVARRFQQRRWLIQVRTPKPNTTCAQSLRFSTRAQRGPTGCPARARRSASARAHSSPPGA